MANGRFLSKSIAEDERLNSMSVEAQLAYVMAVPHLDVDGNLTGNRRLLAAKVYPLRDGMPPANDIIHEWTDTGLVLEYSSGDGVALHFYGFTKNQKIRRDREAPSVYDIPPGYVRQENGALCRTTPAQLQEHDGSTPAQVQVQDQVEVKEQVQVQHQGRGGGDEIIGNIYKTFEENIGMLTGLVSDKIADAIEDYGEVWVMEAIEVATSRNKRSWNYVDGCLRRSKEEGMSPKLLQAEWRKNGQKNNSSNANYEVPDEYADIIIG